MTEKKEYRVRSCGTLVPVTQEVYQAYYQAKRHDKTLCEKDERNSLVSYDGMDTEDILGEEMIPDRDTVSVEDTVIRNTLHEEVRRCVSLLETEEQFLVYAIFTSNFPNGNAPKSLVFPRKQLTNAGTRCWMNYAA